MIGVETDDPDRPFYVSIKNCAVKIKKLKKKKKKGRLLVGLDSPPVWKIITVGSNLLFNVCYQVIYQRKWDEWLKGSDQRQLI